jgi:plasmid maintenance system antidote protein VapI
MATKKKAVIPPNAVHPGEILREDFMAPMKLTAYRLAKTSGYRRRG